MLICHKAIIQLSICEPTLIRTWLIQNWLGRCPKLDTDDANSSTSNIQVSLLKKLEVPQQILLHRKKTKSIVLDPSEGLVRRFCQSINHSIYKWPMLYFIILINKLFSNESVARGSTPVSENVAGKAMFWVATVKVKNLLSSTCWCKKLLVKFFKFIQIWCGGAWCIPEHAQNVFKSFLTRVWKKSWKVFSSFAASAKDISLSSKISEFHRNKYSSSTL